MDRPLWLVWGLLLEMAAALIVFAIGFALYGKSADNWYVSILDTLDVDADMLQLARTTLFLIYTAPAVVFSPIGEEFFFAA